MASYSIVGVVGHIDHGKTSLVKHLTGTDTDTHPEEKRRGITIDLGFASYRDGDDVFAMIDAPGHQKYIGNLLAGVCQVDVGLMVVAADQGIQAQTLEHAGILRALGVGRLIVVVSRVDLCSDPQIETLREELELFLADEGFDEFPIIPVSVVTGQGIDALKSELRGAIRKTPRDDSGPFRMPIDRVFSVPGRGCVVAGTIWSGSVSDGDSVQIAGGPSVRVREIETHGEPRSRSLVGQRTAMNLVGVSDKEIHRGDELVADDRLAPVTRLIVDLKVTESTGEIKCPAVCQFHTAATACEARLTGVNKLEPGGRVSVMVETSQPVVATFGQHCLLRRPYPVGSFASGKVLAALTDEHPRGKRWLTFAKQLTDANELGRLIAWVDYLDQLNPVSAWLPLQLGVRPEVCADLQKEATDSGQVRRLDSGDLVSQRSIDGICKQILSRLQRQASESDNAWVNTNSLVESISETFSAEAVNLAIEALISQGDIVTTNNMLALATDETQLSKRQTARLNQILDSLAGNRTPPLRKKLAEQLSIPHEQAESLIRYATHQGVLVDVGGGLTFNNDVFEQLCGELGEKFSQQSELTVAEIRDHWQLTRKHVVPLLEYCDRSGITKRNDTLRAAGPNLKRD